MLEKNPGQQQMDFVEVYPRFQKLCNTLGVTVEKIDTLANSLGSYGDAWRDCGASQSQIDELYRGPVDSNETTSDVVKTTETDASVNIQERASNLLYASRNLAKANGIEGLVYAIETDHPSVRGKYEHSDIPRLAIKVDRCTNIGKKVLKNAYGDPEVLIGVGFDRDKVENDVEDNEREFIDKYIGPDPVKKKNLEKLRKNQKRNLHLK